MVYALSFSCNTVHYSRAVGTQKLLPFLFPSLDNEPSIKEADAVLAGDILCNYVGEQQRQREQKMVEARKSKTSTIPRALTSALPFPCTPAAGAY